MEDYMVRINMMKIIMLFFLLITSLAATADAPRGSIPAEYNPKYFSNHTENIWLFPDWPFYNPVGISKGDDVHVSNDNFATYKQGKLWSSVVDWDYELVSINGFNMPSNWQAWPTYRVDNDILNSYTHIRLADGSTPVEPPPVTPEPPIVEPPPVVEDPEPPVTPEPEPPVVEEPEPDLNPHPEAEYIQCAWENNTCTLPDNTIATIRYGRTVFTYTEGLSGAVQCSNSVFGDPEFGVGKQCAYYVTESIPPVIEEPEPPVIVEPEPPVIVEPEPEVPPVVEPINKAQLYGLMTRIENLLNTEDPRAAFSTAANMMRDKADLLERIGILKQLISEAE